MLDFKNWFWHSLNEVKIYFSCKICDVLPSSLVKVLLEHRKSGKELHLDQGVEFRFYLPFQILGYLCAIVSVSSDNRWVRNHFSENGVYCLIYYFFTCVFRSFWFTNEWTSFPMSIMRWTAQQLSYPYQLYQWYSWGTICWQLWPPVVYILLPAGHWKVLLTDVDCRLSASYENIKFWKWVQSCPHLFCMSSSCFTCFFPLARLQMIYILAEVPYIFFRWGICDFRTCLTGVILSWNFSILLNLTSLSSH